MIDHTGVAVSDMARSRTFYSATLAPLGYAAGGRDNGAPGARAHYHPDY